MNELSFFSAFLIGLAGGIHCVGMCGGVTLAMNAAIGVNRNRLIYTLAYNAGRIFSYIIAGIITGAVGQIATHYLPFSGPILVLMSCIMLIAMAAYLGNWWRGLTYIERAGQGLWRYFQPFSKRFIPFRSPFHAFPYGMIWGWLPCGLVYSTLTWALASGSALEGGQIMAGFGLGTLPTLIATALGAQWVTKQFKHPLVRQVIACSLLCYAFLLIQRVFGTIH
ncbi:sulfite exporter TauE/SafE family protein [Aestuariibacter sp. A3R04]|uniref:sulfite exporter TauE/SafE family protein n=1 Tax=Aestuariibacter sp. A3R04 TaxID=2841571 RepID=UPI001C099252|nr:sulfite exporter TauE/SafE family protein [Aestuariibacter sp. A3R04]MBU3022845.1 sulfite exporter TauE/SafE family protein [Aestuariibacter sp. A3R04]